MAFGTIVHLGAGVGPPGGRDRGGAGPPPVDRYRACADTVWLVDAGERAREQLERRFARDPAVHVDSSVIDAERRSVTFREYNLAWAAGIGEPDEALCRLYPGLRCVREEETETVAAADWLEERGLDAGQDHLLILDLGPQNDAILEALEAGGQLVRFRYVVIKPVLGGDRSAGAPARGREEPATMRERTSAPEGLRACGFLEETDRLLERHPLLEQLAAEQRAHEEIRGTAEAYRRELEGERERTASLTQERDEERRGREEAEARCQSLAEQAEGYQQQAQAQEAELQQARERIAALEGERDEQQKRVEETLGQLQALQEQHQAVQQEIAQYQENLQAQEQAREAAEAQLAAEQRAHEETRGTVETYCRELEGERERTASLTQERDEDRRGREEAEARCQSLAEQAEGYQQQTREQEAELQEARERVAALEGERDDQQQRADDTAGQLQALQQQLAGVQRQLDELVFQRDRLKELLVEQRRNAQADQERLSHLLKLAREQAESRSGLVQQEKRQEQQAVQREMRRAEDQLDLIKELVAHERGG